MAGFGGLQCLIQAVVILIALSCPSSTMVESMDCPEMCSCDVRAGVMDCSHLGISQVPSPIDSWVKVLRLECDCETCREPRYEAVPQDTVQGGVCTPPTPGLVTDHPDSTPGPGTVTDHPDSCTTQDINTYNITMVILLPWHSDYGILNSQRYNDLSTKIKNELDKLLKEFPQLIDYMYFKEEAIGIKTYLGMQCTVPPQATVESYSDQIYLLIRRAASNGTFSFGMDIRELFISNRYVNNYCSAAPIPTKTDKGFIWWYSKSAGSTASAPCPENPERNATRRCNCIGWDIWDNHDTSQCETPSNHTKNLEDLSLEPVTNDTILAMAKELTGLTQDVNDLTQREVSLVADIIQACVTAPDVPVDQTTGAELLLSVNEMLTVDIDTLVEAERNSKASIRLIQFVEDLGSKMEEITDCVKIVEKHIGLLVTKPLKGKGLLFKTTGDVEEDLTKERMQVSTSSPNVPVPDLTENTAAIHLPMSVVHRGDNENIHFAVYDSARFFMAAEMANPNKDVGISDENVNLINSWVVSAKVGSLDLSGLDDFVTVTLKHVTNNSSKHLCVYWDGLRAAWSPDGCNVRSSTNDTTTCECNHLTNFALLMDIYGTNVPDIHQKILSILSSIGCSVSAAGLILTLLTYFTFRKLLKDNPSKILVNLCAALLGIIVAFTLTGQWFVTNNVIACKASAALTHYFVLAAMAWMSIEAFNMYLSFVRVFRAGISKFLLKCCLIGWGLPLIVVGITMGISTDNYGAQGEICWLPRTPFMAAVMAPVALTLLLNVMTFGLVIHRLYKMNKLKMERSKRSNVQSRLLGAAGIMVLLGLTWIFAFFAIGKAGVAFQYLFVVSNSLQGLFIFIFHCLRNADARRAWMGSMTSATSSSQAPSSTGGVTKQKRPSPIHSTTCSTEMNAGPTPRTSTTR